jgi:hypothetical protein
MKYAVAIYTDHYGKNEIKIVEANNEIEAIQIAVEGNADTIDVSIDHLINYYWDSRKITVSEPVAI